MSYQTWIGDKLRAYGLAVEEYGGWTSRGSSSFTPHGVVIHWTAGPCKATGRPSLGTVVNGRPDLAGPLANVYLDRDGVCVVVAAGRANHAGSGGWQGLSGNSSVMGVEAECCNAGDWTPAQLNAYPVLAGALLDGCGAPAANACRHCDWAPDRKIDTNDLSLAWLQDGATAAMAGGGIPDVAVEQEADVALQLAGVWAAGCLVAVVRGTDGSLYASWWDDAAGVKHGWQQLSLPPTPVEGEFTVTPGPDRVDVFATAATDHSVQHWVFTGGRWIGVEPWGGVVAFPPEHGGGKRKGRDS